MIQRLADLRRLILLGAVTAGVVGGHSLSYLIAVPHGGDRHELLAHTGHGYLAEAVLLALAVGLIAALATAVLGYRRGRGRGSRRMAFGPAAVRLALLQTGSFAVLEVVERILAGAGLAGLASLLVLGALVQVLVATLGAALLVLLDRAGEMVARALGSRWAERQMSPLSIAPRTQPSPKVFFDRRRPIRGPPFASLR